MSDASLDQLKERLRHFVAECYWDQFHSPKNLSMALIAEAAELALEHFQWLTEEQSANLPPGEAVEVELELADIQIYLVQLADRSNWIYGVWSRRSWRSMPGNLNLRQLEKIYRV